MKLESNAAKKAKRTKGRETEIEFFSLGGAVVTMGIVLSFIVTAVLSAPRNGSESIATISGEPQKSEPPPVEAQKPGIPLNENGPSSIWLIDDGVLFTIQKDGTISIVSK